MKRRIGLLMLLLLALSACGSDDAPVPIGEPDQQDAVDDGLAEEPPLSDGWQRVQARSDLSGLQVAPIQEVVWNDGQTVALIRYLSGAEPCSGSTVMVAETDTTITFTLQTGLTPQAAVTSCVAAIFKYEIALPISGPLAGREVVLTAAADIVPDQADPFEGAVFPTDQYLGLSEAEANELGLVEQRVIRVVAIDGESFMVTEDFQPTRVNIELTDGVVTAASSG